MKKILVFVFALIASASLFAQDQEVIEKIIEEAFENSQLEGLGHELMDDIGPRLVGTPQMKQAHAWAVEKYESWGISAENQEWGQWKGWERGERHIDMIHPGIQTLKGTQLAWNPGTPAAGITAETIVLPEFEDAQDFQNWLPSVKIGRA